MSFADSSIGEFLDALAAGSVTPGGGAMAAITGASGAALGSMVCAVTIEATDAEDATATLAGVRDDLDDRRDELLALADADSAAFETVVEASQTPEAEGRHDRLETAMKRATNVPLETAEACLAVLEHSTIVTELGVETAVPDGGTGALLAHAALEASVQNVQVNATAIEDEAFVAEATERAVALRDDAAMHLETVRSNVESTV